MAHRKRMVLYGQWDPLYIDAHDAQRHLWTLVEAGLSLKQVAARLGLAVTAIQRLNTHPGGEGFRVSRHTASKLLAIDPASAYIAFRDAPDDVVVNGVGSRRRLCALIAIGWSQRELAERAGWAYNNLNYFLRTPERGLSAASARRIAAVFDELQLQPGCSTKARRLALRRGWPPPLAWDEETIDDPAVEPYAVTDGDAGDPQVDDIAIERCLLAWRTDTEPPLVSAEDRAAVAAALMRSGATKKYVCETVGWSLPTLTKRLAA